MEYFALFVLFVGLLLLLIRPFTVLFHELGHGIPAILLTKEKVTLYIGSYGDPNKSLKFNLGRLEIWFKYNLLLWRVGLCVSSAKDTSINRRILYTCTGPIASFVIAVVACYFTFSYDLHGSIKLILVIFLGSSIFDLFVNLMPSTTPMKLYDGSLIYNDGYNLIQLFYYKRFPEKYVKAVELYQQQEYAEAATSFNGFLAKGIREGDIYRLAISSYLKAKNYKSANILVDEFISHGQMNSDDFVNAGLLYSKLGSHDKAMKFYDESLKLNPENKYALNNKGYTLNLLERFDEAILLLDKSIEIDNTLAYAYNNRGLSKIKLGNLEEGLAEINYSLTLDKENAYAYRNLGIYHLDKGEFDEALKLFVKSKALDDSTDMIDEFIATAKRHKRE